MDKFDLKSNDMFELEHFFWVIDRYGLKVSDLYWDKYDDANLKYISGKINDSISFLFDTCGCIWLEGEILSNAINHFNKTNDKKIKGAVLRNSDQMIMEVLRGFCPDKELYFKKSNSRLSKRDICYLDINTNIGTDSVFDFIIFLEILLKGRKKEDIDAKEILLEFLFDYFSKKEVLPGVSIKEWIDRYNKKTETHKGYPVRFEPLQSMPLEDRNERLAVNSLKEALNGFEKVVNFFNDGTSDDIKTILKSENINFSVSVFNEIDEFNDLVSLWFHVKFVKDGKNKMKMDFIRDRGYKFLITFQDLNEPKISLSYDNNEIKYKCGEESIELSFYQIDKYSDEYIEEITKKINEVSCCIKRELRDKKFKEKKLV